MQMQCCCSSCMGDVVQFGVHLSGLPVPLDVGKDLWHLELLFYALDLFLGQQCLLGEMTDSL